MRTLAVDFLRSPLFTRKVTKEGYLSVAGRVARTGVQQYMASELELTDRNPNDIVNVYRPPEEVFNTDSLATYLHKEVTDDHPPEMVTADTYKDYSVGQVVSAGIKDGDFVRVDLLVKDKAAIDQINAGKAELSAGYYVDYLPKSGIVDGQKYEFVQRKIVINHIALVDQARAGSSVRLLDSGFIGKKGPDPREIVNRQISDAWKRSETPVQDAQKQPAAPRTTDGRAIINDQISNAWRNPRSDNKPAPSTNGRDVLNQQLSNAWRR